MKREVENLITALLLFGAGLILMLGLVLFIGLSCARCVVAGTRRIVKGTA